MGEAPVSQKSEKGNQEKETKIDQAAMWHKKGYEFYKKKEYSAAIDCLKKAIKLNPVEVDYIINLAGTNTNIERFDAARQLLEESLKKISGKEDRKKLQIKLADIHFWWADDLKRKYDHSNAIKHYEKAYAIDKVYRLKYAAIDLNNIGFVYDALGEKKKALGYYQKALPLSRAVGDRAVEAKALNNIGAVYVAVGRIKKALEYFKKALSLDRAIRDRAGEATTLNNIGAAYNAFGQKQKALEYYEKVLQIVRAIGERTKEAATLNNIGVVYSDLDQKEKALDYYQQALPLSRDLGDRAGEATKLNNIGLVFHVLGQKQKALDYCQQALPIIRAIGDRKVEAIILDNIMFCWNSLKNTHLSIYYGKQSVNVIQRLRANIAGLKKKIKHSYLKSKIDTYRNLAVLLVEEGRLSEGQHVLEMLKIQEYRDFIRSDTSALVPPSPQLDFTPFEAQWLKKDNTIMDKLSDFSNEYYVLKFKKNKNDAEKKRMEKLDSELKKSTKAYENFLAQMKDAFVKHEKEIKEGKPDPDAITKQASALQETLKYLDENERSKNAALHYLVFGGRISVIITTPSEQVVKQTEIDEKEFNLLIMNYRNFILKTRQETRDAKNIETSTDTEKERNPYAKKLYDLIFRPVDEELRKYGATNLMISLDGVLRYIPLGTLWDGENYLVQRYRVNVITPSSLKNIKAAPVQKRKILGLGVSRGGHGFKHLHYVRKEIQAIVNDKEKGYNGLIQGKAFIDHDFTKDTMLKELEKKNYPLVHISSHFKFSPGDETKNFLLLGDGNVIKLSEIRRMGKLFDNVKLLVLSACQTGVGGNGEEIDGFGELAQQSGAKSVVASLWSVEDKSTKDLMVAFYRIMKEGTVTSKIKALRQAQLELAGLEDLLQKTPKQRVKSKTKYSHPYYWGPFIMMGNWR
jgi:CHAT domain-containing protein/Tfp pilus assembly protein PilF